MKLVTHWLSAGGEGAEVVYSLRNDGTLAKMVLDEIGNAGQTKRKYYQRRLPEDPSKDYYFIQRLTGNTEPLLIEYGFIDNPRDLSKLQNNLLDYGEGVVKAVANYIGVPYTRTGMQNQNSGTYTVQRGDSLYSIANRYGITVNELKSANNLTSNILRIGQILTIPGIVPNQTMPGNYQVYTVKNGDTLYAIARKFNVSVNDLINFNQLTTTGLVIGQQLLIPNQNVNTDDNNENIIDNIDTITYTVQSGDSLWKIANTCNIKVDDIVSLNNLQTTILRVGDKILLPNSCNLGNETPNTKSETDISYVVAPGDTLYSISRKYNIPVDEIKNYNNLFANTLQIGQILYIPNTSNYINYYVKQGDTLSKIANEFNVGVNDIRRLNNLTNDILTINQLLLIPKR